MSGAPGIFVLLHPDQHLLALGWLAAGAREQVHGELTRGQRTATRRAHFRRAVLPVDVGSLGADEELDGLGVGKGGDQLEFAAGGPYERAKR